MFDYLKIFMWIFFLIFIRLFLLDRRNPTKKGQHSLLGIFMQEKIAEKSNILKGTKSFFYHLDYMLHGVSHV